MANATAHTVRGMSAHSDSSRGSGRDLDQEVYVHIDGEWRGTPAALTYRIRRYTASGGLTDWTCYLERADIGGHFETNDRGVVLRPADRTDPTETARQRLADAGRPLAVALIDTPEFVTEVNRSLCRMIVRTLTEVTHRDTITETRRQLDAYTEAVDSVPGFRDAVEQAITAQQHAVQAAGAAAAVLVATR